MVKLVNKKMLNKSKNDNAFHIATAPVIVTAQVFGLLPINNIFSKNIKKIKFEVFSIRTLHSILWLMSAFVFLFLEVRNISRFVSVNAKSIGGIVFYSSGIVTSIFLFKVALKWNELLYLFKEVEEIFNTSSYSLPGWSLRKRMKFATAIFLFFALLEHLFSWYSYLNDRIIQADVCGWQIGSWFYYITSLHLTHVYGEFSVNFFSVIWAEYMNVSLTFAWNFVDLFIIIMSLSIAIKFKMINERLSFFKGKVVHDKFWDEIRCHYNKVCELNEFIDDLLGNLICIACLSDLYYVCLQLLNSATPLPYFANKIYFWYSTIFLIGRTTSMFLVSSSINDESLKPLIVFRTIPSNGWFQEAQRLCNQIQLGTVALSGKNFFFLTRGILITIAGTIITYELVLLQFDGTKIITGMFNPCGDRGNETGRNST